MISVVLLLANIICTVWKKQLSVLWLLLKWIWALFSVVQKRSTLANKKSADFSWNLDARMWTVKAGSFFHLFCASYQFLKIFSRLPSVFCMLSRALWLFLNTHFGVVTLCKSSSIKSLWTCFVFVLKLINQLRPINSVCVNGSLNEIRSFPEGETGQGGTFIHISCTGRTCYCVTQRLSSSWLSTGCFGLRRF